jgi:DNA-binding MarR family transcriptional regulator
LNCDKSNEQGGFQNHLVLFKMEIMNMNKYTKYKIIGDLKTTISGKLLLLLLLDVVDEESKITIPQRKISNALGISKSTVSKNLRKLCKNGYIDIIPTYNECGGRMPNIYKIREAMI